MRFAISSAFLPADQLGHHANTMPDHLLTSSSSRRPIRARLTAPGAIEEASGHARRLVEIREELGVTGDFSVITALTDAFPPEQFAKAEERDGRLDHAVGLLLRHRVHRFRADVIAPLES